MREFSALLHRYGRPAALWKDGKQTVGLAMVQPLFEKEDQWTPTPLGRQRGDRFLYLGAPELAVDELGDADYVEWDGQAYTVVSAQPVKLGRELRYRWAVLAVREDEL